jgi:hypothetical protein
MKKVLATVCLLLVAASIVQAEQRLYKIGPVPKAWQTAPPPPPAVKPAQPPSVLSEANASKWERDFSLPADSPGFGKPVGSVPLEEGGHPGGGTGRPGELKVTHQAGTLLVDSQPGRLYLEQKQKDSSRKYLNSDGVTLTLEQHPDGPQGLVRQDEMLHPKEILLGLMLGSKPPVNLVFRKEKDEAGMLVESWLELGFPRIKLKRRSDDGRLIFAQLFAPGGQKVASILWRVKEWQGGRPSVIICTQFGPAGYSITSESLYTLVETSPSVERNADEIFFKGLKVSDQRAVLDSLKTEVVYTWTGSLPKVEDLKRMDQDAAALLPDFLKGGGSTISGVLLVTGICGTLLVFVLLAKKAGSRS